MPPNRRAPYRTLNHFWEPIKSHLDVSQDLWGTSRIILQAFKDPWILSLSGGESFRGGHERNIHLQKEMRCNGVSAESSFHYTEWKLKGCSSFARMKQLSVLMWWNCSLNKKHLLYVTSALQFCCIWIQFRCLFRCFPFGSLAWNRKHVVIYLLFYFTFRNQPLPLAKIQDVTIQYQVPPPTVTWLSVLTHPGLSNNSCPECVVRFKAIQITPLHACKCPWLIYAAFWALHTHIHS